MLRRPDPLFDPARARKKTFPYPPEPLGSLAVRAVTQALRRVDTGRLAVEPADLHEVIHVRF